MPQTGLVGQFFDDSGTAVHRVNIRVKIGSWRNAQGRKKRDFMQVAREVVERAIGEQDGRLPR